MQSDNSCAVNVHHAAVLEHTVQGLQCFMTLRAEDRDAAPEPNDSPFPTCFHPCRSHLRARSSAAGASVVVNCTMEEYLFVASYGVTMYWSYSTANLHRSVTTSPVSINPFQSTFFCSSTFHSTRSCFHGAKCSRQLHIASPQSDFQNVRLANAVNAR